MLSRLRECIIFVAVTALPLGGCSSDGGRSGNTLVTGYAGPSAYGLQQASAGPILEMGDTADLDDYEHDAVPPQTVDIDARQAVYTLGDELAGLHPDDLFDYHGGGHQRRGASATVSF